MPSIRRFDTVLLIFLTSFLALGLCWVGAGPALADPPSCGDGRCTGQEDPISCPEDCGDGSGGDHGGGTIRVRDTFRDEVDPLDRLLSDGLGDYIDRMDKVGTGIGRPGDFFLGLTRGNQPADRLLFFDFTDCASTQEDPECNPPFYPDESGWSVAQTNMFTAGVNLRKMGVDESSAVSVNMALDLTSVEGGLWFLYFDPLNPDCPGSDNIVVTRTGADTWVIAAPQLAKACLVRGRGILSGLYHMPFQVTVQKK